MTLRRLALLPLLPLVTWAGTDRVPIEVDGQPFTTFYYGLQSNKPYLAPLRSASGKIVTRHYPMEKVEGESRDHIHHTGLWFSYDDVNGVKFWENDPSYKAPNKGKIVIRSGGGLKVGAGSTVLKAVMAWNGPDDKTILREDRVMTFISKPALRIIDFDITLTAIQKVVFGDTKEGAFAIRLADALAEKNGTGKMVNAEGAEGMKNVWGKRSNWVDYFGTLEGEQLGVAIFDHPSNPRHPTYWHSRDYGLFALDPFGQHAFDESAPESQWTVEAGKSLHFRWRVVIHNGDPASAHIAELYQAYAQ
jgi:Methane oxygenase PmoA